MKVYLSSICITGNDQNGYYLVQMLHFLCNLLLLLYFPCTLMGEWLWVWLISLGSLSILESEANSSSPLKYGNRLLMITEVHRYLSELLLTSVCHYLGNMSLLKRRVRCCFTASARCWEILHFCLISSVELIRKTQVFSIVSEYITGCHGGFWCLHSG